MIESGARGESGTPAPLLRRQMLYPAELRARPHTLPNSALKTPELDVGVPCIMSGGRCEPAAASIHLSLLPLSARAGCFPAPDYPFPLLAAFCSSEYGTTIPCIGAIVATSSLRVWICFIRLPMKTGGRIPHGAASSGRSGVYSSASSRI